MVISNPPYNMKWEVPVLSNMDERFLGFGVPPESNANYAFILSALNISDTATFILPAGVLTTTNKEEAIIRQNLIVSNYLEAVIACPDKMFEATSIPTVILLFNKKKTHSKIAMIDARQTYIIEKREQRGQFGSKAHTNRVYSKEIKTFSDEQIDKILDAIENTKNISEFSKAVSIEECKANDYLLTPSRYIEFDSNREIPTREYKDIVNDINHIITEKNKLKLTINETLAKAIGFDLDLYKADSKNNEELNQLLSKVIDCKIIKCDYFSTSKNKNEVKFENKSKDDVSSILMMIFQAWKQHLYYLNIEENKYLVELRDKLLPELMSGKIKL